MADSTPIDSPAPAPAALLAAARAACLREGAPCLAQRRADLQRLKAAVIAHRLEFEAAAQTDFGQRSAYETTLMDLVPIVQSINHLLRNLRAWMRPVRRPVSLTFQPGRARVLYQPLGVVGIVSPWNFPVALALMPLACAIAAGNRALLKPSEITPASSALLARLLAGLFEPTQVAVVRGGAEVGAAFTHLPFDHLLFTGSTAVGRAVMRAASDHLVPVTLELGGKSPAIIEQGWSPERAARSIAYGKLANAGQICISPDYALLHEADREAFVQAYARAVEALYPHGCDASYTSIVDQRHFERLLGLLADARAKGAQIIELNQRAAGAPLPPRTIVPTLVLNTREDMAILREEIFGPVLPLVGYRSLEQAIGFVNARPRPLALYYFGDEGPARRAVLTQTVSGNVTVNDTLLHYMQENLPFGGIGPSGMGAYHGIEGFRAMSHAKGVFEQARWNFADLARPPFRPIVDRIIAFLLR